MAQPPQQTQQPPQKPQRKHQNQGQELQISSQTREKAEVAKAFIEDRYAQKKSEEKARKEAFDNLVVQMQEHGMPLPEQQLVKSQFMHMEAEKKRQQRQKQTVREYEPVKIIGRGAFGEVRLCRIIKTGELVAVKKMKKKEMVHKNQVQHVKAERDVLAKAKNPCIVNLRSSFQDDNYLYLIMDYLPGGDLMTLLMRKDILSEEESRFYIAEMILAVESVHKLGYIHRDLKPDNVLLDQQGHIKLSDFGLCKHTQIRQTKRDLMQNQIEDIRFNYKGGTIDKKTFYKKRRQLAFSTVGTPDYIAPEVFGQSGYVETVDWWSIGVILFEMLVGYPPFFSDDPSITCQKILHWRKTLVIPPEANLSPAATDILKKLICDHEHRLGKTGVQEIKMHPFFEGVDWENIRTNKSPYTPKLKSDIDTEYFDNFDEEEPFYPPVEKQRRQMYSKKTENNFFIGYTYNRESEEEFQKIYENINNIDWTAEEELKKLRMEAQMRDPGPRGLQLTAHALQTGTLVAKDEKPTTPTSLASSHILQSGKASTNTSQAVSSMAPSTTSSRNVTDRATPTAGYPGAPLGALRGIKPLDTSTAAPDPRKATTPTGALSKSPVPLGQPKRGISPNTSQPRESGGKFTPTGGFATAQNFYQQQAAAHQPPLKQNKQIAQKNLAVQPQYYPAKSPQYQPPQTQPFMPYQQQYPGYKMGEPKSMKQLPDGSQVQQNTENLQPGPQQRGGPMMPQPASSLKRTIEAKLHMNSL